MAVALALSRSTVRHNHECAATTYVRITQESVSHNGHFGNTSNIITKMEFAWAGASSALDALKTSRVAVTPLIPNLFGVAPGGQRVGFLASCHSTGHCTDDFGPGRNLDRKGLLRRCRQKSDGIVYDDGAGALLMWCCEGSMAMPMSMDNCPMCAAMDRPRPSAT